MKRRKFCVFLNFTLLLVCTAYFQFRISVHANEDKNPSAVSTILAANSFDNISPKAPSQLSVTNRTYTSISIKWAPSTDNVGVRGYEIYRDGKKIISTKKTEYTNTSLIPGRSYSYAIKAYDAAGNISMGSIPLIISTIKDIQTPSVPKNLSTSSSTHTTATLTWESSTDNTGIKNYEIFRNGTKLASTSATYYVCKRLTPGNTYSFTIKACDIAGNYSALSNSCSADTVPDTTEPSIPSTLKTSSISATEINLTWTPSYDNVKVKGYEVFRDGESIGTTSRTSMKSSNLVPGKSYSYAVRAFDGSDNISNKSPHFKVKTQDDLTPPQAPAKLNVSSQTKSSVSLKWQASTDNIKIKGYHVYCNGLKVATTTRTSYTVKGLSNLGFAVFNVKAYDLADNLSESSNNVITVFVK